MGEVDYIAKVELTNRSSEWSAACMMKAVAMPPANMKGTARKLSHTSRAAPDMPWPLQRNNEKVTKYSLSVCLSLCLCQHLVQFPHCVFQTQLFSDKLRLFMEFTAQRDIGSAEVEQLGGNYFKHME